MGQWFGLAVSEPVGHGPWSGFRVGLSALQDEIGGAQEVMGAGDDRALGPAAAFAAGVLRAEMRAILPGGPPSAIAEGGPEEGIPLARLAPEAFARTFVVTGTDAGPGGQVVVVVEDGHVGADFG